MGRDAFDPSYAGYAIFPDGTWLTDVAYVENGAVVWNNGMTEDEIAAMNAFARRFHEINDSILNCDYYAQQQD